MRELDPLISEYAHEKHLPREAEALHTIQKIASLVKPIMRARSWRVGTLAEFYPAQTNLLGLNVNKGEKILLRLRYPGDVNQFMPIEQVVDTMLHELSHLVFGDHDDKFNALWGQLREEYQGLVRKGYTGEGFLSEGRKLGGQRIPRHEARRIARIAAEKRRTLSAGSGQKLGGAPVRAGTDIRQVIVDAIERRATITLGCGSGRKDEKEIRAAADQALRNGFRTKAEEDEANDQAIAQALWDLVQEDEKAKYGTEYIPASAENPIGNGGGEMSPKASSHPWSSNDTISAPPVPAASKPDPPTRPNSNRPVSRLVSELSQNSKPKPSSSKPSPNPAPPGRARATKQVWECPTCTCHNPVTYLSCDACTTDRPVYAISFEVPDKDNVPAGRPSGTGPGGKITSRDIMATKAKLETWRCQSCSTIMENKWWTCSTCGTVKLSS